MRKQKKEVKPQKGPKAGIIIFICFVVAMLVVIAQFNVFTPEEEAPQKKEEQQSAQESKFDSRKNIYDRNFMELAVSFQRSSIYARPLELEAPDADATLVAEALGLEARKVRTALKGERSFVWLAREVANERASEIEDLNLKGVYRLDQLFRFYPEHQVGAHVVGFLKDGQGLAGVESFYDHILRGEGVYDSRLAGAGISKAIVTEKEGGDLILTLDVKMQAQLERELARLLKVTAGKAAMAAVMIPESGEILALASQPAFDPNRYWEYDTVERRNRVIEDTVSLGGLSRLFARAAALEAGAGRASSPQSKPPPGGSWTWVQDGVYASPEAFLLGSQAVEAKVVSGFAEKIGLESQGEMDLPEAAFSLRDPELVISRQTLEGEERLVASEDESGEIGIAASPMALLASFSRLINGGKQMTPHVLKGIWYKGKVWQIPASFSERYGMDSAANREMATELKGIAGRGNASLYFESLEVKKELPRKAGKDGQPEVEAERKVIGDVLLLGAAPAAQPEIALVLSVEGAVVNIDKDSKARAVAQKIMRSARKLAKQKALPPNAAQLAAREEDYYKQWQKLQTKAKMQPVLAEGPQGMTMPDVRGYSLRRALQVLQQYGLRMQITGSGQVVSQYPLAGTSLRGVEQCVLELKVMQ